jgi:hypothetical protein
LAGYLEARVHRDSLIGAATLRYSKAASLMRVVEMHRDGFVVPALLDLCVPT